MSAVRNAVYRAYVAASEALLPPQSHSAFDTHGTLTPEEFVRAGDYLVQACPTWTWEAGDPRRARPFLPAGKQFLATRGVPCRRRADAAAAGAGGSGDAGDREDVEVPAGAGAGGGAWLMPDARPAAPATRTNAEGFEELPDLGAGASPGEEPPAAAAAGAAGGGDADVPDLEDLQLSGPGGADEAGEADEAAAPPPAAARAGAAAASPLILSRSYDLHISYDKHAAVPRFWLLGYDEARAPLPYEAVLEDVVAEYRSTTVTREVHPHAAGGLHAATVHPCRHAATLRALAGGIAAGAAGGGGGAGPSAAAFPVERVMVLFLKFIASVVPTIECDYTLAAGR